MAKVPVTVDKSKPSGTNPTVKAITTEDEYQFKNDGRITLRVTNGGAEPTDVTVVTPGTKGGLAIEDQVVTVPDGQERYIGPFETDLYNDADGNVTVKFSKAESVTLTAIRVS